jgi:chorismate--pyruvate lyase
VYSWITESNSLTQRLRDFYGDTVKVSLLFHQWKKPFLNEAHHLQIHYQHYSLIREVLLSVERKPLILARTILPKQTIQRTNGHLSNLGTRPLGDVIFSYPRLQRLKTELCWVSKTGWSKALQQQLSIEQSIWGRRNVYLFQQQPLLVSELFLPEVLKCC